MGRAIGVTLILTGVGLASSLLLPIGSDADPAVYVPAGEKVGLGPGPRLASMTLVDPPASGGAPVTGSSARSAGPRAKHSAPIVVTVPRRTEPTHVVPYNLSRTPPDPVTLTRDLQRELRRVGCYGGELNGAWTATTRKAMKAFTERVNATLPVDDPDQILLALVRAHRGEACGRTCPQGESMSEGGRCVAKALLVQAAKSAPTAVNQESQPNQPPAAAILGWTTVVAAASRPSSQGAPPLEGRMALSGPRSDLAAVDAGPIPGPAPQLQEPKKPAVAGRRGRRAASRDRRPAPAYYPRRSRFVESVLRNRFSPN